MSDSPSVTKAQDSTDHRISKHLAQQIERDETMTRAIIVVSKKSIIATEITIPTGTRETQKGRERKASKNRIASSSQVS